MTQTHTAEAGDVTTLERENRELRAYLKAFCRATIEPEEVGNGVGVHEANPTIVWTFRHEDEQDVCGGRYITGGQVRRAMELVGFDKLNIKPATRTIADDLAETAALRRQVKKLRGDVRAYEKTMEAIEAADRERLAASPAPRAPAAVPEEVRRAIEAVEAAKAVAEQAVADKAPFSQAQAVMDDYVEANRQFEGAAVRWVRTLAAAPAAPPADGGTEGLLADPNAVHINMLAGKIAKPSVESIIHIYGADVLAAALSTRTPAGAAGDSTGEGAGDNCPVPDPEPKPGIGPLDTQLATRPASPAPAASAGGEGTTTPFRATECKMPEYRYQQDTPGGFTANMQTTPKLCFVYCGDDRCNCQASLNHPSDAALAPAAQVNPGREEIARLIRSHVEIGWKGHDNAFIEPASITQAADAILAARPVAEGDAGWIRTGWGSQGVSPGSGKDEWFRASDGALQSYPYGFNPNTGRYEGMTLTSAARPAPSPAKGGNGA
jgi:hypothetical protein